MQDLAVYAIRSALLIFIRAVPITNLRASLILELTRVRRIKWFLNRFNMQKAGA
jgi:hypothetical protein